MLGRAAGTARGRRGRIPQTQREQAPLPRLALVPVLAVAAAVTGVLAASASQYGYHRDELYFLECGRHLAWGYPDQPPFVPLVARLTSALAPGSLVVLRLPSALAAGALVLLTALLTRELRGGRAAQVLACAVIALAPVVTGAGHRRCATSADSPVTRRRCCAAGGRRGRRSR